MGVGASMEERTFSMYLENRDGNIVIDTNATTAVERLLIR